MAKKRDGIRVRVGKLGRSYEVCLRIKKQSVTRTFATREAAEDWRHKTRKLMRDGEFARAEPEASKHTLADAIDQYLTQSPDLGRDSRYCLEWWKREHGKRLLSQVTKRWLQDTYNEIAQGSYVVSRAKAVGGTESVEGSVKAAPALPGGGRRRKVPEQRRYAAGSANRKFAYIRAVLNRCVRWEWLEKNPADLVDRLPEASGRTRFLNDTERERLLQACRHKDADRALYPFTICALYSGARAGELLSLRWADLDLATGTAVIHTSKSGHGRKLYFPGAALTALQEHAKVRPLKANALIFASDTTGKFPFQYGEPFRAACKRAKVVNFRFHDLRHSCASYLAQSGMTLQEIGSVLGHRVLQTTLRYAHLVESQTEDRMRQALEARLGKSG